MNRKHALLLLAGALALATITSLQLRINQWLVTGRTSPFTPMWAQHALEWTLWAAVAPVVWWIERRYGTATGHVARGIGIHLAVAVAFVTLQNALVTAALHVFGGGRVLPPGVSFIELVLRILSSRALESLLIYGLIVGAAILVREAGNRSRKQAALRAELTEARLQYLRAQIQPHFLFNTLHGIAGLVREGERDEAVAIIGRLGRLLRRALAVDPGARVELAEELEDLMTYIEIQRMRFGDLLRFSTDVPDDLGSVRVPPLILQPLVENAVRHGLRDEGGSVHVSATREGDAIMLRVRDDGAGLAPSSREGIGIGNLRERLATMYGSSAELNVRSRSPESGVEATIRLPCDRGRGPA